VADDINVKVGVTANVTAGLNQVVSALKNAVSSITGGLSQVVSSSTSSTEKVSANNTKLASSFTQLGNHVKETQEKINSNIERVGSMYGKIVGVFAGGVLAHTMIHIAESTAEYAEQIERASQKTGIATDTLQVLKGVAELNEVSFRALQVGLQRLSMEMTKAQQGSARSVDEFKRLGISAGELKGMGLDEVLLRIADRFSETANNANKMTLAQQILSRTGREFIPLLNLGSEGLREQMQLMKDLGLVMDETALKKAAALNDQIKLLRLANQALTREMSMALVPAFTQVINAMVASRKEGGNVSNMAHGVGEFFKNLVTVATYVIEIFDKLGNAMGRVGAIIAALFEKNWAGAWDLAKGFTTARDELTAKWDKFRADMQKPIEIKVGAKEDLGIGAGRSKPAKLEPDNRMAEWREELQKRIEAEVGYFNDSKALEIKFWEDKLAIAQASLAQQTDVKSKAYQRDAKLVREIERMLFSEHKAAAQKQLSDDIRVLEDEAATYHHNIDEQIRLAKQVFDIKSIYYSQDIAKIADANKKVIELEQKKAEMVRQLLDKQRAYKLQYDLADIAREREQMALDADLGRISADQRYELEVGYAARSYQLQLENIRAIGAARLAELKEGSIEYLTAQEETNRQILDLTRQSEAEIVRIKNDAIKQAARNELEAIQAVQGATSTLLEGLMNHTKSLKDLLKDFVSSIQQSISRLVSQSLTDKLMGAGTSGQGFLSQIFGKLFGSKEATGATSAADTALAGLAAVTNTSATAIGTISTTLTTSFTALTTQAAAAATALASVAASKMSGSVGGIGKLASKLLGGGSSGESSSYFSPSVSSFVPYGGGLATGTNFVPQDALFQLHRGEAVIPAKYNTSNAGTISRRQVQVTNNFSVNGPLDTRTQDQVAAKFAMMLQRAHKDL
jgi:sorbitol-specific phosphotransferase system component IIBC